MLSGIYNNKSHNKGFTLVELSIVIVIIGFLVAGISAGSNMIKQAQLRSVITDLVSYQASYNGFVSRYNRVPGDMNIASAYWNTIGNCADTVVNCNGNGDGSIDFALGARGNGTGDETERAWKHLALSGSIGQGIVSVPDAFTQTSIGVNSASSRLSGAGYLMASGTIGTGITSPFDASVNAIFIGKEATNNTPVSGALKPEDAFNIDQKVDDGSVSSSAFSGANTGFYRSINGTGVSGCLSGLNYNINTSSTDCLSGLSLN